jgi:polyferredoxin
MSRPRRPDPPPLKTNDVRVAAAGTVAWAIALVVLLIVGLPEEHRWWLWVCVSGVATGLFGIWYIPRLHNARIRQEARHHSD